MVHYGVKLDEMALVKVKYSEETLPLHGTKIEVSNDEENWITGYFAMYDATNSPFIIVERFDNLDFPEASGIKFKHARSLD